MNPRDVRKAELLAMFNSDLQAFGILIGLFGEAAGRGATVAGKSRDQIVEVILNFEGANGRLTSEAAA